MEKQKRNDVAALLRYAGGHKGLTFLGLALSGLAMLLSMVPYICIWLAARDLIAVAPDWTQARSVTDYGWIAFAFAVGGILIYFLGLMCTHLAAFRTAANIRKQGVAHVMKAPLGFFDSNAAVGHTVAQVPHPTQCSGATARSLPSTRMAPVGHASAQRRQEALRLRTTTHRLGCTASDWLSSFSKSPRMLSMDILPLWVNWHNEIRLPPRG